MENQAKNVNDSLSPISYVSGRESGQVEDEELMSDQGSQDVVGLRKGFIMARTTEKEWRSLRQQFEALSKDVAVGGLAILGLDEVQEGCDFELITSRSVAYAVGLDPSNCFQTYHICSKIAEVAAGMCSLETDKHGNASCDVGATSDPGLVIVVLEEKVTGTDAANLFRDARKHKWLHLTSSWTDSATHVVVGTDNEGLVAPPVPLAYQKAVASGKYVVVPQWLMESMTKGGATSEEGMEVVGVHNRPLSMNGPYRSRTSTKKILAGVTCVVVDFKGRGKPEIDSDDLVKMIEFMGGKAFICRSVAEAAGYDVQNIIYNRASNLGMDLTGGVESSCRHVSYHWILRCAENAQKVQSASFCLQAECMKALDELNLREGELRIHEESEYGISAAIGRNIVVEEKYREKMKEMFTIQEPGSGRSGEECQGGSGAGSQGARTLSEDQLESLESGSPGCGNKRDLPALSGPSGSKRLKSGQEDLKAGNEDGQQKEKRGMQALPPDWYPDGEKNADLR